MFLVMRVPSFKRIGRVVNDDEIRPHPETHMILFLLRFRIYCTVELHRRFVMQSKCMTFSSKNTYLP